jgi:alkanesulfonate monooxygenase SsuD/methylene tetrahydromethanopterin reductase-like flavin-dependent oxidoreductase (luciferase family)
MFAGETFDYDGAHFHLQRAIGRPVPAQARVPVHIGGGGPKLTMPLVERFADWWNCPGYALDRIDELRPLAGRARISTQHPIGLAPDAAARDDVIATAHRRFGAWGGVIAGTADEVASELAAEVNRGVEGFVLQFSDFGTPETIQHFMSEVAPVVRASR